MQALDRRLIFEMTGLSTRDFEDEEKLAEVEAWLTTDGAYNGMTFEERRMIPAVMAAIRTARAALARESNVG